MLHIVNRSPFERTNLESCLLRAAKGSAILLYEDAVYAALGNTSFAPRMAEAATQFEIYVLQPDLAVRGVAETPLVPGIRTVDYGGFVDLTAQKGAVQSWP